MTLNQLRNHDFIALCRSIAADKLKNGQLATIREILEEAIMTPPKAHYIDFDDAVRMLRRIENTGLRNFTSNELQRDKWIEFHDQVREAMNSRRRLSFLSLWPSCSHSDVRADSISASTQPGRLSSTDSHSCP